MCCFALLGPTATHAADRSYETAIVAARGLVKEAMNGARDRVPDAISTLETGTGSTQPEILADLRATPPDLADADARLAAVEAALNRPGDAGDPAAARSRVEHIIGLPRYDGMRGSQSAWDRFLAWVAQGIAEILYFLLTNTNVSPQALAAFVAALALLIAGLAFLVLRTTWSRGSSAGAQRSDDVRAAVRDRFARADLLAAEGDHAGALRELVAGVAGEVGNRPFWDSSPLTVRELFASEGLLSELGPLLQPFEASVYGRRNVSGSEFAAALAAAARFRSATVAEAA